MISWYFKSILLHLDVIWKCGCCHHDNHHYKLGKEYDRIYKPSTETCDGCRDWCLKDKNCTGIECDHPHPTRRLIRARMGFSQCNIWKIRPARKCETHNIDMITCWKEDKSKIHFITMLWLLNPWCNEMLAITIVVINLFAV